MDLAALLGVALEEAGTAIAIVAAPEKAGGAILEYVNLPFARMLGLPAGALAGARVDQLEKFSDDPDGWHALLNALSGGASLQHDFRLRVAGVEAWFGFRLTFAPQQEGAARYGVIVGRDVTASRKAAAHGASLQRLLAEIFLRIAIPVVITSADGVILMCNTAFCTLLSYRQDELKGAAFGTLVAGQHAAAAAAARATQLRDEMRFDMSMSLLAKGGAPISAAVTSILLRDGEQRLRVVTIRPTGLAAPQDLGEVRAISLSAFRSMFADRWEQMSLRAMMKAEHLLRRRLGPGDVLTRTEDSGFVIWFAGTDQDRNAAVLDAAVREIRLRFLADFGAEIAGSVTGSVTAGQPDPQPAAKLPCSPLKRMLKPVGTTW